MQIRWEENALADLTAIREYIEQDNPIAAQKIAQRILRFVNHLVDQPLLGQPGKIFKTRELVISNTPYTIIYHATADMITILRIFHQARKWPERL